MDMMSKMKNYGGRRVLRVSLLMSATLMKMLIKLFGQPWPVTMRWIISRGNMANEKEIITGLLFVAAPVEAITTDKPTYGPSEHIQCLAMNMYHEARDQGTAGNLLYLPLF